MPFCLGLLAGVAGWLATTEPAGFFLVGLFAAGALCPPAAAWGPQTGGMQRGSAQVPMMQRVVAGMAPADGLAVASILPWFTADVSDGTWFVLVLLPYTLGLLLVGLTCGLRRLGLPVAAAVPGVQVAAFAWLSWPVWLAGALAGGGERLGVWLAAAPPPFAVAAALQTDITHRPWAYELMNIGQDVFFATPGTAWWAVGAQAVIGVLLMGLLFIPAGGQNAADPPAAGATTVPGQLHTGESPLVSEARDSPEKQQK
ncbi:MAG: hypothetical protein ACFCVE_15640 [Phycisphaerae bacterium]